jgi:hypothetical protein
MSESKRTVVRTVPHAKLWSDGTITLENCRASYPHVFKPQEGEADDGTKSSSYSIVLLMPKSTHRAAKDLCKERYNEILKENSKDKSKPLKLASDRLFIKDGDTMAKDENEGMWVVSAREKNKPALRGNRIDPDTGKPVRLTDADSGLIFGGCYVSCLIRPWFQNNKYGKRINAGLVAVQYLRKGEPFGEGRIRDEDIDDSFEAVEDDTGGFDDDDDL